MSKWVDAFLGIWRAVPRATSHLQGHKGHPDIRSSVIQRVVHKFSVLKTPSMFFGHCGSLLAELGAREREGIGHVVASSRATRERPFVQVSWKN